jgi:hypothetical protein
VFITFDNAELPIPESVAVCPECFGKLYADLDGFEKYGAGENMYKSRLPMVGCEDFLQHGEYIDEDAEAEVWDTVQEWLDSVVIKFYVN